MKHVRSEHQDWVQSFMRGADQHVPDVPTLEKFPFDLRMNLIIEEALEFCGACGFGVEITSGGVKFESDGSPDFVAMIDALCDILYVVHGAACSAGIDIDPFFEEVHRTNMHKLSGPVRDDGKRLKPEGWKGPRIKMLLDRQIELATKDMREFEPKGAPVHIPGGRRLFVEGIEVPAIAVQVNTQGQENVVALRKPDDVGPMESKENARLASHSLVQLRQLATDLSTQLEHLATRNKQLLAENSELTQRFFELHEEQDAMKARIQELEESVQMSCIEPDPSCDCAGCSYAKTHHEDTGS